MLLLENHLQFTFWNKGKSNPHWDNPMNFLVKLFSLFIGIFSLISTNAAVESFPLKELDCDWDEDSVTIPNHLTVKIDNAAIWGYHAYTADLNQDGKPDYLLHQTYTTCGKYAGYGKVLFFLSSANGYTKAEMETLAFSIKDVFLRNGKVLIRQTIFDEHHKCRANREYPLTEIRNRKSVKIWK